MKTFRELCNNKPSVALRVMVQGLRESDKRKDFSVKMKTFGDVALDGDNLICVGCAATCAIQKLTGINFTVDNIYTSEKRANAINISASDLLLFENAINEIRLGRVFDLFEYFKIWNKVNQLSKPKWKITSFSDDWREQLFLVEEYILELEALGL